MPRPPPAAPPDIGRRGAIALGAAALAASLTRPAQPQPLPADPALGFIPVPDWVSAENQGAGIAVLTPATGGAPHLVVFMVDAGPQQNRGLYRLGRALDTEGRVTGGWTAWFEVPDWFAWENQGGGIAILERGAARDLVVLMVDAPAQQNRGLYRLGRGLDADGAVTGGWTPWVEIPDWFPWDNQGAGIAVTPADPQGQYDLVVFMIDNGPEQNRGLWRLGRALDANGVVTGGWTPWQEVPGWLAWENQGGGIAVTPPAQPGGAPGLIAFQIDNPPISATSGQNQGFFKRGSGLGTDGSIAAWAPGWSGVPHWFAWENAHGAIATARLGGRERLLVLMIDSPAGPNAGLYQVVDLEFDPARHGQWQVLPFDSGVLGVHAALLPGGDVLFFAGSGSSQTRFDSPDFGDIARGSAISVVWRPADGSFTHPPTLRTADGKPYDLFCGGDAFLADGHMVSVGGTIAYPFVGRQEAAAFDPVARRWSFLAPMAAARWYPTLISLADGGLLAVSGLEPAQKALLEVYLPATNTWQPRPLGGGMQGLPLYAHLFQLADGRVFYSGGHMDDQMVVPSAVLDITQAPVSVQPVPGLAAPVLRNQSTSVLLPPAQAQRVMVCGGGPFPREDQTHATDTVSIADLGGAAPAHAAAAPMGLPRLHHNAVLLPDRTVFVCGGALAQEALPLARLQAESYDPALNQWRMMATASVPRLYHSTAVLLPDGRVVTAGSNPNAGHSVTWMQHDPQEEMRLEVFSPPYLFRGPRPVIGNAPAACAHGETITIASPQAGGLRWAQLMRGCVTTHSFDGSQRLVDLPIAGQAGGTLRATVPGNRNLAPPGWYMLFLVDQQGIPSVGHWIRLG